MNTRIKTLLEERIVKKKGIEIYYNSRDHRFSSSGLRKQVKKAEDK